MFHKKTINDVELHGKHILLRADYNVPIKDGEVASAHRIKQSVETIKTLLDQNCKVVIISHLGRPKSKDDTQYSLKPVAKELSRLLEQPVFFASDCIGEEVSAVAKKLKAKEVLLLENLRFYSEEKENDREFAEQLARDSQAELFVQDGFGVVHRSHASTDAITEFLPSVAGHLLAREVDTLSSVMNDPDRPLMAIVGGAKIADKIDILKRFIELADVVVVGGAMASTFLKAQGVETGESLVDDNELETAHSIMDLARAEMKKRKFTFYLPQDAVVADEMASNAKTRIVDFDTRVIADIESYPKKPAAEAYTVGSNEKILDIGPFSSAFIVGAMQLCKTVIWNGTMGVAEVPAINDPVGPFAHGTKAVIDGLVGHYGTKPFSVLGGGDTAAYIDKRNLNEMFNHVSTGGGASLELMSGKKLPGVEVLQDT